MGVYGTAVVAGLNMYRAKSAMPSQVEVTMMFFWSSEMDGAVGTLPKTQKAKGLHVWTCTSSHHTPEVDPAYGKKTYTTGERRGSGGLKRTDRSLSLCPVDTGYILLELENKYFVVHVKNGTHAQATAPPAQASTKQCSARRGCIFGGTNEGTLETD